MVALVAAIAAVSAAIIAANDAQIENAKATIESQNAKQAEIDANTALYNSYKDLEDQYKEGIATKEQLDEAAKKVIEAYELEGQAVNELLGDYEKLNEEIAKKRAAEVDEAVGSAQVELSNAEIALKETAKKGKGGDGVFKADGDTFSYDLSKWRYENSSKDI